MDKTGEIILLHCRDKIRSVLQAKVRVMAILYKLDLLRSKAGPHFFPFNIFSAMMWPKVAHMTEKYTENVCYLST